VQTFKQFKTRMPWKVLPIGLALAAVATLFAFSPGPLQADDDHAKRANHRHMKINAGTVFNLAPVFDANGNPVFPWFHEVRGVVQVSNLGNCKVVFHVTINAGTDGHANDLEGTMTITTLAGDKLETSVVGWGNPDPKDPSGRMFTLHYDVTVTGGTGKLEGARGFGEINGAFMFSGNPGEDADTSDDRFCDGYAGVATWLYEGVLVLPRHKK